MSANDFQSKFNVKAVPMPKYLSKKALDLFSVPSTGHNDLLMGHFIMKELEKMNLQYRIDHVGNMIVTKGVGPYPCFCAHLDTVHTYRNGFSLRISLSSSNGHTYIYSVNDSDVRVGIGGDDKCGIFTCLYLLHELENVKIFFFTSEESGGIGSGNVDLAEFDDCRYIAGIDRWNGEDFVTYYGGNNTISAEFLHKVKPLLKRYGYSKTSGLFTDSFNIMERYVGLSCVNISCGYYGHHSAMEHVDLNELYNCCLFCKDMALRLTDRYLHEIPRIGKYNWNEHYRNPNTFTYGVDDPEEADVWKGESSGTTVVSKYVRKCWSCNIPLLEGEYQYCMVCKPLMGKAHDVRNMDYYD